ncbi:TetR/AcrR family transcriptional regulator [Pantoea cypripedii]|uniref:TetR/AcrR family transcriptional regulator n=1 Tax=Pantoea cypripedii TaxID=55209 RepID=A0A6B9GFI2_PANCY|nr:TetR/AcrR family transcriptional regulator [Pantoea cypripedii]QGY32459.1 TetR/AcrR family transcriptional regulator [Pantoea cypripedii]
MTKPRKFYDGDPEKELMARTKAFEREEVLHHAIRVFAEHGFAGTSMEMLLEAMGLSRQSIYDTFGDKKQLYTAALGLYVNDSIGEIVASLVRSDSPARAIEEAIEQFIARPAAQGCLGILSVCEFGIQDDEISRINAVAGKRLLRALEGTLLRGQAHGDFTKEQTAEQMAGYLAVLLNGLRVASRAGASQDELLVMKTIALRALR